MPDTNDDAQVLQRVLDTWREGVNSGDPLRVSEVFTDDAIFQGLKPYSVGQEGVFDYYAGLPDGMTVEFEIKE
ncbi:hypothetical protein FZI93_23165, partial [Mycobacterium sp. CBMA361]|nr:hypothetical protein [Mycolicibacterium sp. CBMA 361]